MGSVEHITGMGIAAIDKKGRVALPPTLRNAVMANNAAAGAEGRNFFIGKNPASQSLIGYDRRMMDRMEARIEAFEESRGQNGEFDVAMSARRRNFPRFESIPFDASGRFVLTPRMMMRAGLVPEGLVFFYGLGTVIELWNPDVLLADPDGDPDMQDDCRYELSLRAAG